MKLRKIRLVAIVLGLIVAFVATVVYGFIWVWARTTHFDFMNQQSAKPQERVILKPPSGIVPVDRKEIKLASRDEARALINPIPATPDSVETGRNLYRVICIVCHGPRGEGQGVMGTVPALAPQPARESERLATYLGRFSDQPSPNLNVNYVQNLPDGEIYYTITYGGFAIMPSFRDRLDPEDRWHLINYIRKGLPKDARKQ